jgi:hypothetical protein
MHDVQSLEMQQMGKECYPFAGFSATKSKLRARGDCTSVRLEQTMLSQRHLMEKYLRQLELI